MIIQVKFNENNQSFKAAFGEAYGTPDDNYKAGYDLGYGAGYDIGEAEGYRDGYQEGEATGFDNGYTEGAEAGYNNGLADGKQSESDAFWDAFQNGGNRTYYGDAFRESTLEYVHPKHKITPTYKGGAARMFYASKKLKKAEADYLDFSQIPRGSYIFEGYYNTFTMCYELEEVEDIGFVPTFGYGSTFNVCKALRKIAVLRADADTQFLNDTFGKCIALEEITFEGVIGNSINFQWSTKLNRASIENIITCLADNQQGKGKTLTLSKAAVDEAFRGISAGDFTTIVDGTNSVDWITWSNTIMYKGWTLTLV